MGHFVTEGTCNIGTMFKSMGSVLKKDRSENNFMLTVRREEMRFHYLCTTPKRLNYCLYLWRSDVSGRDTGKDRKWLLNNMLRISTKLYFNWTLQQNDPTSVVPLSSVTEEFKSAKSQSRGCRIRQTGSPNTIGASITQYMYIMVRGTNTGLCFFYDQYMLPYHHQPIRSNKRSWM